MNGQKRRQRQMCIRDWFPHPDADFFRHNAVRYHFPESDAVPVFPAPQPLPGRLLKNLPLDAAQGTDFRR